MVAPEQQDVEVEWQLDAIDLRPVERWFSARSAGTRRGDGAPATGVGPDAAGRRGGGAAAPSAEPQAVPLPLLASMPGLEAVAQPVKRLVDSYFDTPDWRLGRSGYVLRTRQRAGRHEATLKDLAPSSDGLRRRLEVTEPLPSPDLAGLHPAGPVGRRVRALVGGRTLGQVLEVRTRRRPYALEVRGTAVGEVALDDTVIVAGEERHRIRLQRVEVEVLPAWVESLSPLVERLRHDCGLQPATLSKFEAGLLGAGFVIPRPSDLGPTGFSATATVAEVAYAVLRKDAASMLAHEPGTRLGEDIESLHQMRVATRRMRAALSLFETVLPARAARVHEELGWLAGVLGSVRDLDIQLGNLDAWTEELPGVHRQALDELGDLLLSHHESARLALLEALDSRRYERLVGALTSMLDQGPLRRASIRQAPALDALPELIGRRHREAEKAVRRAHRTGIVEDFHRLRIRCKRLRYAIEFTGDLYGGDVKRYARQVASLQDELGLIQDAETAANRLQDIALGDEGALLPRETVFAMGMVSQRCAAEAVTRLAKLPAAKRLVNGKLWDKAQETMERRRQEAAEALLESQRAQSLAAEQALEPSPLPGRARPVLPTLTGPSAPTAIPPVRRPPRRTTPTASPQAGRSPRRTTPASSQVGGGASRTTPTTKPQVRQPPRRTTPAAKTQPAPGRSGRASGVGGGGRIDHPVTLPGEGGEAKTVTPIRRNVSPA
ncbi:MAG: CHAD domain-containing protein [Acidimicrobiales bacterium]